MKALYAWFLSTFLSKKVKWTNRNLFSESSLKKFWMTTGLLGFLRNRKQENEKREEKMLFCFCLVKRLSLLSKYHLWHNIYSGDFSWSRECQASTKANPLPRGEPLCMLGLSIYSCKICIRQNKLKFKIPFLFTILHLTELHAVWIFLLAPAWLGNVPERGIFPYWAKSGKGAPLICLFLVPLSNRTHNFFLYGLLSSDLVHISIYGSIITELNPLVTQRQVSK